MIEIDFTIYRPDMITVNEILTMVEYLLTIELIEN
jgi:hypothetical protein